jgi:carboxylesterase
MKIRPPILQYPEMDGASFYWPGNKHNKIALLFFHGFTATTVEVKKIATFFNHLGFSVSGPLLPGHGTTPADLNKMNWTDWTNAAEKAYYELRREFETVYVFGESMGGLLTLWLADKYPEIKKIFLFAPAIKIDTLWQSVIFWPFAEFIYKRRTDSSMLWQGYNVIPLRAASQLYKFQRIVKKLLRNVKADTMIFQGKLDQTINQQSAAIIINSIESKNKKLVWLEKSSHCILLDKQLPEVQDHCLEAIQTNTGNHFRRRD